MGKVFTFLFFFLFIPFISPVFAQQETDDNENEIMDREIRNEEKDYDDFGFITLFSRNTDPTIEVLYGRTETRLKGFMDSFGTMGSADLRIGYTKYSRYYKHLIKLNHKYLLFGNLASDLVSKSASGISPETWRFGLGHFYGYGYKVADVSIVPFSSNSLVWSYLSFGNMPASLQAGDQEILARYNEAVRFGQASEGGLKILFAPFLTFSAGFERSVVFPRHLFWKQAGSMIIEYMGYGAIDEFVKRVIKTSPYAGPIVNFALKNGFSYAFYELRKDNMNWPFKGASPVLFETWKVGMTFIF